GVEGRTARSPHRGGRRRGGRRGRPRARHQVAHRHQHRGAHRRDRALRGQGEARHRQATEVKGLSAKTVLVTGGGGAIGAAICRRFAEAGASVLVCDKNREAAERVAREVNGKALVFDIASYTEARSSVGGEPVDILVNNAGWDRFQNFLDTSPEQWEGLLDVNLRG